MEIGVLSVGMRANAPEFVKGPVPKWLTIKPTAIKYTNTCIKTTQEFHFVYLHK